LISPTGTRFKNVDWTSTSFGIFPELCPAAYGTLGKKTKNTRRTRRLKRRICGTFIAHRAPSARRKEAAASSTERVAGNPLMARSLGLFSLSRLYRSRGVPPFTPQGQAPPQRNLSGATPPNRAAVRDTRPRHTALPLAVRGLECLITVPQASTAGLDLPAVLARQTFADPMTLPEGEHPLTLPQDLIDYWPAEPVSWAWGPTANPNYDFAGRDDHTCLFHCFLISTPGQRTAF